MNTARSVVSPDTDMDWVDPWVGSKISFFGWVGSNNDLWLRCIKLYVAINCRYMDGLGWVMKIGPTSMPESAFGVQYNTIFQ
jgi:hypothetical protein